MKLFAVVKKIQTGAFLLFFFYKEKAALDILNSLRLAGFLVSFTMTSQPSQVFLCSKGHDLGPNISILIISLNY